MSNQYLRGANKCFLTLLCLYPMKAAANQQSGCYQYHLPWELWSKQEFPHFIVPHNIPRSLPQTSSRDTTYTTSHGNCILRVFMELIVQWICNPLSNVKTGIHRLCNPISHIIWTIKQAWKCKVPFIRAQPYNENNHAPM